jgi:hypothetical protein
VNDVTRGIIAGTTLQDHGVAQARLARRPRKEGCSGTAPEGSARDHPGRVRQECGALPFVIRRDGTWLYRGTPIGRKELVCLFSSVLKRDEDGVFWLETPAERGRIEVEDAPFLAVELDWTGCGRDQVLTLRTNVDQLVTVGPEHPIRISHDILTCEPTPYLLVRPGDGRLPIEARISRAVYYELVALGEPHEVLGRRLLGVWSCGCFYSLGELPRCCEE